MTGEDREVVLRAMAADAFACLGDTKIVEDCFNYVRDRETRDTRTKVLKLQKQLYLTYLSETITEHQFTDVRQPPGYVSSNCSAVPRDCFFSDGIDFSLSADSLLGPRDWPSLKPVHFPVIAAQTHLIRHCQMHSLWNDVTKCWHSAFLPLGSIFRRSGQDDYFVSLGDVTAVAVRAWPVHALSADGHWAFSVATDRPEAAEWEHCLQRNEILVTPVDVVAPCHGPLVPDELMVSKGICFLSTGPEQPMMEHAARNCFWKVPRTLLDKLALSLGVPKAGTEMVLLWRLVTAIFPDMTPEDKANILELRGKRENEHEIDPSFIPDEAVEELISKDDQEDVKDRQGFVPCQTCV